MMSIQHVLSVKLHVRFERFEPITKQGFGNIYQRKILFIIVLYGWSLYIRLRAATMNIAQITKIKKIRLRQVDDQNCDPEYIFLTQPL